MAAPADSSPAFAGEAGAAPAAGRGPGSTADSDALARGRGSATAAATPAPLLPALAGFFFDLLLWVFLLAGGSLLGTVAWGFVQGLSGASPAQAAPPMAVSLAIGLVATAFAALIVYYFRRNANAVERSAAWRALSRPSTWMWIATAIIVLLLGSSLADKLTQALNIDATRPTPSSASRCTGSRRCGWCSPC